MFVDASALTAMLTDERYARELLARAQKYPVRFTSPLAVWETVIAVAQVLGFDLQTAASAVEDFLILTEIEVVPCRPKFEASHSRPSIGSEKGGIPGP